MYRLKRMMGIMGIVTACVLANGIDTGATTTDKTTAVTTAGSTTAQKAASADNSLKSLTLSEGTLTPAFVYNTVNYTASVSENTTSIDVNAVLSDSTATIKSVTGNTDLKEGENTVKIVVEAANGNLAAYTIQVTRGGTAVSETKDNSDSTDTTAEQSDDTAATGDTEQKDTQTDAETAVISSADGYTVADSIPQSVIPSDFTQTDITYQDAACKGLKFDKGDVVLLYMVDANANGVLFVYDQTTGDVYPFVELTCGNKYIILLQTPSEESIDESYTSAELTIDGKSVTGAYQTGEEDSGDFYLIYAVNSDGTSGWYQYDASESTYQRYITATSDDVTSSDEYQFLKNSYQDLTDKYTSLKDKDTRIIAGLIIALAVFLIIIVNLLLRGGKNDIEEAEEENGDKKGDVFASEPKKTNTKKKHFKKVEMEPELTDQKEEEALSDFEEEPELLSGKKIKKEKEKKKRSGKEDIFDSYDEEEDYYDEEEPLEEKKKTSSLEDDLEILDLNDL